MAYILHGADQQGRRITGIWTAPHRTHRGDFADTYPTGPAPLDGAHAVSDIQGDEPAETRPVEGAGPVLWLVGLVGVLLAALVAWHLAARFA